MARVQNKLHLLLLWLPLFFSFHHTLLAIFCFHFKDASVRMEAFSILHVFSGPLLLPSSLKHMDAFDMLFTCHWHDDYFEKCCVSRSVHIYVIAGVFTYLAEVLFYLHFTNYSIMACPSSVPAVSQQVHMLQMEGDQTDDSDAPISNFAKLLKIDESVFPVSNPTDKIKRTRARKKRAKRLDGIAIDPQKAFVDLTKTRDHVHDD